MNLNLVNGSEIGTRDASKMLTERLLGTDSEHDGSSRGLDVTKLRTSIGYLLKITLLCNLSTTHFGLALSSTNAVLPALKIQLGWPKDQWEMYITLISSASVAGVAVGCVCGGSLIANGRKRMITIFTFVQVIGSVLAMIPNTWVIMVGRFIYGFCSGIFAVAGPKILNETVPAHLLDFGFGCSTNIVINLFVLISMLLGIGMPTDQDKLATTHYWQVVYGVPLILNVIQLILNTFMHTEDSL